MKSSTMTMGLALVAIAVVGYFLLKGKDSGFGEASSGGTTVGSLLGAGVAPVPINPNAASALLPNGFGQNYGQKAVLKTSPQASQYILPSGMALSGGFVNQALSTKVYDKTAGAQISKSFAESPVSTIVALGGVPSGATVQAHNLGGTIINKAGTKQTSFYF